MARANRHFVAGQIWHVTQRCAGDRFRLGDPVDRRRWRYWLFQARRRYRLSVLNYVVTSNHVHVLLHDSGNNAIGDAVSLMAESLRDERNKRRRIDEPLFDEDFSLTAVEPDVHLARCMLYIDMHMVRAGAVEHPGDWAESGYHELMRPRRRGACLDLPRLAELLGHGTVFEMRQARRRLVDETLTTGFTMRESLWTESAAVGSLDYALRMRRALSFGSYSRRPCPEAQGWSLRESSARYRPGAARCERRLSPEPLRPMKAMPHAGHTAPPSPTRSHSGP